MIKNFKNSGFCCLHDWHGRACFCCPYSVSVTRSRCAGKFFSLQALFQLTNFNCSQQTPARCFQIVLNEVWSFCEHLRGSLEPRSPAKRQFYEFLAIIRLVLYNSIWVAPQVVRSSFGSLACSLSINWLEGHNFIVSLDIIIILIYNVSFLIEIDWIQRIVCFRFPFSFGKFLSTLQALKGSL